IRACERSWTNTPKTRSEKDSVDVRGCIGLKRPLADAWLQPLVGSMIGFQTGSMIETDTRSIDDDSIQMGGA
ncbi:MAG: hypothetical protein VX475_08620, partial [Myxococcota bacterium]|nr:hypothetical protein [Myxococcota bacterium]